MKLPEPENLRAVDSRSAKAINSPLCCSLDGIPLTEHERCKRCDILIGPKHLENHTVNGLCSDCQDFLERQQERVTLCQAS
jgi:RNA polymerase-binding transcription factor DksA